MAAAKNWADLPRELLGRILNKLCINNIESFKMVCHHWHSAFQEEADLSLLCPAPSPPWLTIPLASEAAAFSYPQEDEEVKKETKKGNKDMLLSARFFNPTNSKVCFFQNEEMNKRWLPARKEAVCVGSSHGWLAFIDTRCVIYLTNPFKKPPDIESSSSSSKYRIQLPSIETLPCILGVEREYPSPSGGVIIDFKCWDFNDRETSTEPSIDLYEFFILKLVVSSAPDDDDDNDCTVMAIYGEYHDLAFCKLGDTSWTTLNKPTMLLNGGEGGQFATVPAYEDIYYSSNDQCFYAFRFSGSFDIWDLRTPSLPKCTHIDLPKIASFPPSLTSREKWLRSWCTCRKYLVNFFGDTLLVIKFVAALVTEDGQIYTADDEAPHLPYKTMRFDVYKLDWVQKQWVHVRGGLGKGDGVLFLGINNAMTFSACDFPALRGNSIYFTDDIYDLRANDVESPYGGHDSGIFGLEDNNIHPCFYPVNYFKRIFPPPVWIAPNPW